MRRVRAVFMSVFLAGITLAACENKDTGHVQLQLLPPSATTTATLYLDGKKLDFSRGSNTIMRFSIGRISLKAIDSVFSSSICTVVVRKNRLSILTVMATENPPRCICQIRAPDSTPSELVCT